MIKKKKRKPPITQVLTVDPGDNTGWAYWSGQLSPAVGEFNLTNTYREKGMQHQLEFLWSVFNSVLNKHKPSLCYIESVVVWDTNNVSRTAARRGNLMKLSYLIGGYMRLCFQNHCEPVLMTPNEWKGQLPNAVVSKRIQKINGEKYKSEHQTCAVGIGMSLMELL